MTLNGTTTLVLDSSYQVMNKVSWQRAFEYWVSGKVEILEEYADRFVRSASQVFKVPSIIRFVNYISQRKRVVRFSRSNIYTRDHYTCQYCGKKCKAEQLTYDHVVPRSKGGKTNWSNIVAACQQCNRQKGDRTPEQAGMKLRSTPVKPKKLPTIAGPKQYWKNGMPDSWKAFLIDASYWEGELVAD
jgi:5-methylcytosine-specific restriction endonuclease McrA